MGLDIYVGGQITPKSIPVATVNLPSELINFLNAKNIFIDEYDTCHLQKEQIVILEKLVNEYLETKYLEKKYLKDVQTLIEIGKNNSGITLVGD